MATSAESIILVEDDPSLRHSLGQFLQDHGFKTISAGTCREAWEIIRKDDPALCLLDLNLPDGCGLDIMKNIVRRGMRVRVIVMTALPIAHLRQQFPAQTLVAWLTKPVDAEQLLQAVQGALRGGDAPSV